ncbi:MAG: tetratricopeptide repeat protein [Bryobacterales bacterium]|nr:tetratricopeptide repeat protein [Bryobacteraceae bacterium]MDW8354896.1 tetratricopeptide repeat protein [Bryobacterales bacterium]
MDRITRKALKKDAFAEEVGRTVTFIEKHRRTAAWCAGAVLLALILGVAWRYYSRHQHQLRQQELAEALRIHNASVGPEPGNPNLLTFPTIAERQKAAIKAFQTLAAKYPGTEEGLIARYYLGTIYADQGKMGEAIKAFQEVAASGHEDFASLAKFALADAYAQQGKLADGEKLLRELIERPTMLVSKEQATISLARLLARSKPQEARKLLEPLRTQPGAVGRVALTALSEIATP